MNDNLLYMNRKPHKPPYGFADIPGYEDRYAISREGVVYSYNEKLRKQGGIVRLYINQYGYFACALTDSSGKQKNMRIHRLVAITYISNPDPMTCIVINHINGIKTDNRVENLEWCTRSHNTKHAYTLGLKRFPEKLKAVILATWDDVRKRGNAARSKPVTRISEDGHSIQKFSSIRSASRTTKVCQQAISAALCKGSKGPDGFKWVLSEKSTD